MIPYYQATVEDGDPDDLVGFSERKVGNYIIDVVPEEGASPIETYSLEIYTDKATIILAENVQISDIPIQPYKVLSTETGIKIGEGTAEDPYQIYDVNELQNMIFDLNAHYILINDVDASSTSNWNDGSSGSNRMTNAGSNSSPP